jgi:uracil-DNA glycosylase family 4
LNELEQLNYKIYNCRQCPRLINYINSISPKKRYKDQIYWSKPLAGFGDYNARLLIIGLAPAAHGGNRTGRMFTGDSSGNWLIRALYLSGFANKDTSINKDDGLILKDAYITAVVRCAPPNNKPLANEIFNCIEYLKEELRILPNIKIVLALGSIAFNTYTLLNKVRLKFYHGAEYNVNSKILLASYHPSRQNTQTKRLSWNSWLDIFNRIKIILK